MTKVTSPSYQDGLPPSWNVQNSGMANEGTVGNAPLASIPVGDLSGIQPQAAFAGIVFLAHPKYNANLNGTNDDTALAAAVADVPAGGTLVLPAAQIGFSTWTITKPMTVQGTGYYNVPAAAFGNSQWASTNYGTSFGGTVLVSSATSGSAIVVAGTSTVLQASLRNLMILGPGSGTSIGLSLGAVSHALEGVDIDNVICCNFSQGWQMTGVEDSCFTLLAVRGCTTAGIGDGATNNNTFNTVKADVCGAGITIAGDANTLNAPLFQGCTGAPMTLSGYGNTVTSPYFENASGTGSVISHDHNTFIAPTMATSADTLTISGNANLYLSPAGDNGTTVSGNNNMLVGNFNEAVTLSGSGNNYLSQGTAPWVIGAHDVQISPGQKFTMDGTGGNNYIQRNSSTGDTRIGSATGLLDIPATTTGTAPSAGAGNALPATPAGYLTIKVGGTSHQIAYY